MSVGMVWVHKPFIAKGIGQQNLCLFAKLTQGASEVELTLIQHHMYPFNIEPMFIQ